jgi:hypothetical protein
MTTIRSTSHSLKDTNKNKLDKLNKFIAEYRRVGQLIVDLIWEHGYKWTTTNKETGVSTEHQFSIKDDNLETPSFIDYKLFGIQTPLSARALSSLVTQVAGCISATTEVRRRRLWVFNKLCDEGVYNERLYQNLQKFQALKPDLSNINPELSSKCIDWEPTQNTSYFNGVLRLKCIGDEYGHIKLPIRFHKHNSKYADWKMLNSFLIGTNFVNLRWEKDVPPKTKGVDVGADQGKLTIISLSDRQTTPKTDSHGHSLDSIIDKLSAKRKGSRAFLKAQSHRENFINWSVNQLNLMNIKHLKLEEINNINYGRRTSRKMSHWTNTLIRDKVSSRCEEAGVHFTLQSCTYRSQRCSCCGLVRKSNRKGKIYICRGCGFSDDADYNASCNHEQTLPDIPPKLRKLELNRKGFYWKETGFYTLDGDELRVHLDPTTKVITVDN